jgi:hypothetical protein
VSGRAPEPMPLFEFGPGMRWVRWSFSAMAACLVVALVVWLAAGGRTEFVTSPPPWSWRVVVPAWLSVLGMGLALVGGVLFARQLAGSILGRLEKGPVMAEWRRGGGKRR